MATDSEEGRRYNILEEKRIELSNKLMLMNGGRGTGNFSHITGNVFLGIILPLRRCEERAKKYLTIIEDYLHFVEADEDFARGECKGEGFFPDIQKHGLVLPCNEEFQGSAPLYYASESVKRLREIRGLK